jgi:integrase
MGELQDRMDGDLRLRGLSEVTRAEYLRCAAHFCYYRMSPEQLSAEDVRSYLLHLVEDQHFSASNMKSHIAAIKFLFSVTLNRPAVVERVRFPKVPLKLLDIPSPSEVAAVLSELQSPVYRTLLFCAYGAGLRVSEACNLCVGDIDSTRMVIIVRNGKGGRDRYAMLSPVLLDALRTDYRQGRPPQPYLFQGKVAGKPARRGRPDRCAALAVAVPSASRRTRRHATHLPRREPICASSRCARHANIRSTVRYVRQYGDHRQDPFSARRDRHPHPRPDART